MDFSTMSTEQIEGMIKILQKLLNSDYGDLSEENKALILIDLRDAKLEHILNR